MYNIMIVDDEPVIRFGLKASIDWKGEGLFFAGDYSNGQAALEAMKTQPVDILITDIKMPLMDGLTLMKHAINQNPSLKVILISSYNDFDFVKEGLVLGAVDYVLKPTLEPESLLILIKKCAALLSDEQRMKEKMKAADQTAKDTERRKLEHDFKSAIVQTNKELPFPSSWKEEDRVLIMYMKLQDAEKIEAEKGTYYKSLLLDDIQQAFYEKVEEGICFPLGQSDLIFFLHYKKDGDHPIQRLKQKLEKAVGHPLSFGYEIATSFEAVPVSVERSKRAFQRKFFYPEKSLFPYPDQPSRSRQWVQLCEEVDIESSARSDLFSYVEKRVEMWKEYETDPDVIKQAVCGWLIKRFYHDIEYDVLLERHAELVSACSLIELTERFKMKVEECEEIKSNRSFPSHTDNELIDRALTYIHEHYQHELTLQLVADHIHISRNYFSLLFKRLMKQTFIDYVIELRIKKAKELLGTTTMKVYEVAEQSGFKDVKYFSKLFKKTTGRTPVDYRSNML
ncbi:response regulator transcription factor [Jeotgalibacillus campisalis]|uniref:AraC family transcriptional regulator n=1 Tax=Jeotgalibacillus campisalis TaxID=220754 RepID=A0A0C2RLF4_9BACL|nr:response regulator [Jeotgalibacillus campisalis]KIL51060.1 hypothetical protein KR50_09410 [Jeotgalibacillus campisalis]